MDAVLHLSESLMASPWLYLLVLGLAALDGFVPIVPAETVVIAAAAHAVTGEPEALPLLIAAWTGAVAGDLISHHLGRGAGPVARWFRRRRWGGALFAWAERELGARGGMLLISARFIPGGRTATTLTSGIVRYPRPRFLGFATIAGLLWALYGVGIGLVGGVAFRDRPLLGVAMGIGLALLIAAGIETVRGLRRSRARSSSISPAPDRPISSRSRARSSSIRPEPDRPISSRSRARSSSIRPEPDRPISSRSRARSSSISPRQRGGLGAAPAPGSDAP